jgi:hypothetical protein
MAELFTIASTWESDTLSQEDRDSLKACVEELVGYPCKIACKENNGSVDIYVLSVRKNKVTDWIEIQSTGAVGVSFDMYYDPDSDSMDSLEDRCEEYNEENDVQFEESDSEPEE